MWERAEEVKRQRHEERIHQWNEDRSRATADALAREEAQIMMVDATTINDLIRKQYFLNRQKEIFYRRDAEINAFSPMYFEKPRPKSILKPRPICKIKPRPKFCTKITRRFWARPRSFWA
ncbi:hypothetical protein FRX31_029869 [Thalictrum thalictroides]|uniref:Uncharacterized protein n=1 Tax=Thalictrum thalictroides TaxID=46969 RepID=A0A7J6V6B8_THATH|nr:hypothetical protein FRX31_029869 [Thalictrum thalictroides]